MVEKLKRSSWVVQVCSLVIIAQAGGVEFTAAKPEGIKSIILVSCLVHSSKFKWSFFELVRAKIRQTIGRVKVEFKTFAVCSIEFAFNFIVHLKKTECDFEDFIVVIKCKNYLENVYCVFCCIFCCVRLSPFDEVV